MSEALESTVSFPKPDEGLTEGPADGIVGCAIEISKEETCEFYYQLSLRMPAHQFACVPHPIHVESDPRLAPLYNKILGNDNRTNEIQVEYHRLCKEDPENIKEHYKWYQNALKLEPVKLGHVEEALVDEKEEKDAVASLFASLSFLSRISEDGGDEDTDGEAGKGDGECTVAGSLRDLSRSPAEDLGGGEAERK